MQRALIVGGVLGLGTTLVFGAAAVTATLFPNGPTVVSNGPMFMGKGDFGGAMPIPEPMPVIIDDGKTIIELASPAEK